MASLPKTGDTIAAPATPNAPGAVALVRLSGPQALAACSRFTRPLRGTYRPRRAVLAEVFDSSGPIDTALVTWFRAPASYTGEEMAEIACHGSPYIVARIMRAAIAAGARPAGPGEFTFRACRNGKMDLAQAEGVGELVAARTAEAHRLALGMAGGGLSKKLDSLKNSLVDILAQVEVRLDDGDDEQAPLGGSGLGASLRHAALEIEKLSSTFSAGHLLRDGVRVAITGAPNAGKSSLLNALLGFDRAIVAPTPGTTRDTIEEELELEGRKFLITDTAGLRLHALDPAENEGMARTRAAIGRCDLAVVLLDCTQKTGPCELQILEELRQRNIPLVIAANKSDLADRQQEQFPAATLRLSCKTGDGLAELRRALVDASGTRGAAREECIISSARHHACLRAASDELATIFPLLERENPPLELAAEHLRRALEALSSIAGGTAPDDVLAVIFSKFCVGK